MNHPQNQRTNRRRSEDSDWKSLIDSYNMRIEVFEKELEALSAQSMHAIEELQDRVKHLETWSAYLKRKDVWRDDK